MAKQVHKPTAKALENTRLLRVELRNLYRACNLDPEYSGHSSTADLTAVLQAAKDLTDVWIGGIENQATRNQVKEAVQNERMKSAQTTGSSHLYAYVREAYRLVQLVPTWQGLPQGDSENKLKAIEALLKSNNSIGQPDNVLNSISLIVGVTKHVAPPKPKPKPKKPMTVDFSSHPPAPVINPETGMIKSKYDLTAVDKDPIPWGWQAPYYLIKKGTPMTWGGQEVWVDKGAKKPGKPGDTYYVHPEYVTGAIEQYNLTLKPKGVPVETMDTALALLKADPPLPATEEEEPLLVLTDDDEGSDDGTDSTEENAES